MQKNLKYTHWGLCSGLVLALCAVDARATVIDNFVGAFAPSQWTLAPEQGTTAFVNSDTELDIVGPTGNFYPSYDSVSVGGPTTPGGQPTTISFNWSFNAGDAQSATASISWAGEPDGNPLLLASGGPGSSDSGTLTLDLAEADTLTILLDSDVTGAGKQAASLDITQFSYSVPDATPWIDASLLLPLLLWRFRPVARQQS